MNKVMAAAGRREVRDLVGLVTIHHSVLSLGAAVWASVAKSPGFTPEGLIAEIRGNSHYPAAEWRALIAAEPLDPRVVIAQLNTAIEDAEAFVRQPDPDRLEDYQTHAGQRRGARALQPETKS